jgi:hypothetical protein
MFFVMTVLAKQDQVLGIDADGYVANVVDA